MPQTLVIVVVTDTETRYDSTELDAHERDVRVAIQRIPEIHNSGGAVVSYTVVGLPGV